MKLWRKRVYPERCDRSLRHEFVIGPRCDSSLFAEKARVYYCVRCRWNFLVCRSRVAVLDERGNPLTGTESSDRFNTFEEGPCPVLEALTSPEAAARGMVKQVDHPTAGPIRLVGNPIKFQRGTLAEPLPPPLLLLGVCDVEP